MTIHQGCRWRTILSLVLVLSTTLLIYSQTNSQRPMIPDDLFQLEEIGQTVVSPDDQLLAYVLKRPLATEANYGLAAFFGGNERGDVWLVSMSGSGKAQRITDGISNGCGYYSPVWSPDGQRLAMLQIKNGSVLAYVWERKSAQLKQLSERAVDPMGITTPLLWISNQELVFPVLPKGEVLPTAVQSWPTTNVAPHEWEKASRGKEPTSSALESGTPIPPDRRPQKELMLFDFHKGEQKLATALHFSQISASPNRLHLAFVKDVDVVHPSPTKPLEEINISRNFPGGVVTITEAMIVDKQGASVFSALNGMRNVQPGSLQWSPAGTAFALTTSPPELNRSETNISICAFSNNACHLALGENWSVLSSFWASNNTLMLLTIPKPTATEKGTGRPDWWAVGLDKTKRNVTEKLKSVPRSLLLGSAAKSVIGVADGDLWRIQLDSGEAQNLTADFEPKVASIVFPREPHETGGTISRVILGVGNQSQMDLFNCDLESGKIAALVKPVADARLVAHAAETNTAVFTADNRTGNYLWLNQGGTSQPTTIVKTNTFLNGIAQAEYKGIDYVSQDGQKLKGWVMLPIGYQEGKRYPLVTWVYAGRVYRETPPPRTSVNYIDALNLQLLAARGYAVLMPSMPLKPTGVDGSDPYFEMTKGVLPAVDKVIALGIADPDRLGLMGQSFGGYSTYSLVTQTKRFNAAVALAGISDVETLYGQFHDGVRYSPFAHENLVMKIISETSQMRMGKPPWKEYGRYVRNSPIFHVERVETPLLMISGDMDYIVQAEQFFSALYRQGKRARFVRYWGEGHTIQSPANVYDLWQRIFAWLDEFCDISRDEKGNLVWDGDKVKSRNGAPPLKPDDFARFDQMIRKGSPKSDSGSPNVITPH